MDSIIIIIDNVEEGELKEEKNVFYRKNSFNTENKADESVMKKKPIMFIPKAIVLITSPGIHCACANMRKLLKYGDLPVYSFDRPKKPLITSKSTFGIEKNGFKMIFRWKIRFRKKIVIFRSIFDFVAFEYHWKKKNKIYHWKLYHDYDASNRKATAVEWVKWLEKWSEKCILERKKNWNDMKCIVSSGMV